MLNNQSGSILKETHGEEIHDNRQPNIAKYGNSHHMFQKTTAQTDSDCHSLAMPCLAMQRGRFFTAGGP
jgi:hypothetical protein